jgi:hypothetical protein
LLTSLQEQDKLTEPRCPERLRLFDVLENGKEKVETLELTVVVDNGILEVYAPASLSLRIP